MTRHVLLGAVLALSVCPVSAQEAPGEPRWFVTGSVMASHDQPVYVFEDRDTNVEPAWDLAAGGGVGWFVAERWSLQVEVTMPRRGHSEVVISPPPGPPSWITYWSRWESRRSHLTAAALLGVHFNRRGRVRPSVLVGGVLARLRAEETYQELFTAGSSWRTVYQMESFATHPGVVVGLDVETRLTPRAGLVAQARGALVPNGMAAERTGDADAGIARIGAGLRWRF